MKPITVWLRGNDEGRFEHNHIEDGHSEANAPVARFPEQEKSWKNGVWWSEHAWLIDNKVVRNEP